MKHLRLSLALTLGLILSAWQAVPAAAQQAVTSYINGSGAVQSVTPSFPLPMTGTVTASEQFLAPSSSTASGVVLNSSLSGFAATQGSTAGFIAILEQGTVPSSSASISPVLCYSLAANASFTFIMPSRTTWFYGGNWTAVDTSSCSTYTPLTPLLISWW